MKQAEAQKNNSLFDRIDQVGVVVRSVDDTIRNYEPIFGKDAFVVVEGEAPATLGDGREVMIKGKLGFLQLGEVQLELIEIKNGPSVHVDFLERCGEGIHHVGVYVTDFDDKVEAFQKKGIKILQQGQGARRYAYMDTKPVILELIEQG